MIAMYWFELVAGVAVDFDFAWEFRYRSAALPEGGVALIAA